jgi:hypothetical protein
VVLRKATAVGRPHKAIVITKMTLAFRLPLPGCVWRLQNEKGFI